MKSKKTNNRKSSKCNLCNYFYILIAIAIVIYLIKKKKKEIRIKLSKIEQKAYKFE